MNISCIVGMHNWAGCKCAKCNKTRKQDHDWKSDCETCKSCGATRKDAHQWDGCKCKVCGKIRDQQHDWKIDCESCKRCGATRKDAHQWNGGNCAKCGKKRDNGQKQSRGSSRGNTLSDCPHRLTPITEKQKADLANTWEKISKVFASAGDTAQQVDGLSGFFDLRALCYKSGQKDADWELMWSLLSCWGEHVIRKYEWEWWWFKAQSGNAELLSLFSKDRRKLIILDILRLEAGQGKLPAGILNTLYQHIGKGEPLEKMSAIMTF